MQDIQAHVESVCRSAKEAADYITDKVDEDGIWNALKHFGVL